DETTTAPLAGKFRFEALGPAGIGWWAALSAAVVLVHAVGTIAFSTMYLQVNAPEWPRADLLDQPILSVAVLLALALALAASWWGARRIRGRERTEATAREQHLGALGITLVAGLIAVALVVTIWLRSGLDPQLHAYNSAIMLLLAAQGVV